MIGTLSDVYRDMEQGVYNFCKEGKCIGCGQCCSDLLPLSDKEIRIIEKYIHKKHIEPALHGNYLKDVAFDLTCPFLDNNKACDKCKIYEVRPKICRVFKCDTPPSRIKENKAEFNKTRKVYSMRELFFGE